MKDTEQSAKSSIIVAFIILCVVAVLWFFISKDEQDELTDTSIIVEQPLNTKVEPEPIIEPEIEEIVEEIVEPVSSDVVEPEIIENPLPELDDSDSWLQEKLLTMTWRKELLKLIIDEDMIRRFVVFTDNFSQGQLAYEHSPLVRPQTGFLAIETDEFTTENGQIWLWDEKETRRFSLYVDLLRSFDSESLVNWYGELKPLIDKAYAELGYPDENFTQVLQDAITRVLDMEIPKQPIELIRPSVMYRYKDSELEALSDADKLLLRIGKENLLVLKSVLLEISEKLARQDSER